MCLTNTLLAAEFPNFKKSQYIVVMGSPGEAGGMGGIVKEKPSLRRRQTGSAAGQQEDVHQIKGLGRRTVRHCVHRLGSEGGESGKERESKNHGDPDQQLVRH